MFCSLILRIRQISICNNFEKFPSRCNEKLREEGTPHCTLLTVNIRSIPFGNSKTPNGLFLACEKLQLSVLITMLLALNHSQPKRSARVRKEPWDHIIFYVSVYYISIHSVSRSNQCASNNLSIWILPFFRNLHSSYECSAINSNYVLLIS